MPEGCDLHEQSTGSPRRLSASSFRLCRHPRPWNPPSRLTLARLSAAYSLRVLASGVLAYAGTEGRSGALPGRGLETPSGTPQKGGSGTPQKGGCRDTKQCKFWRVSSVLIQGMFCFWGVRGVLGGPGGVVFGVIFGVSAPWKMDPQTTHPGPCPCNFPEDIPLGQASDVADVPAVR